MREAALSRALRTLASAANYSYGAEQKEKQEIAELIRPGRTETV